MVNKWNWGYPYAIYHEVRNLVAIMLGKLVWVKNLVNQ